MLLLKKNDFRVIGTFPFATLKVFSSNIPSNKCISYCILEKGAWTFLRIKGDHSCKIF